MIVGITGAAGSGKNAVADILIKNLDFKSVAFADSLKESVVALDPLVIANGPERLSVVVERDGMDVAKNKYMGVRKILQDYGVAMRESVDEDVWVKMAHRKILSIKGSNICLTDLRFNNELKYIMNVNGVVIKVVRPNNPFDIGSSHVSEQMVVDTPYTIVNNFDSLEDLESNVLALWSEWNFKQGYQKRYMANNNALCRRCDNWKDSASFPKDNRMSSGVLSTCRECTSDRAKLKPSRSSESRRTEYENLDKELLFNKSREKLLQSYGLTVNDYEKMLSLQGGVCAICKMPESRVHHISGKRFNLAVDHDHETGMVRGLLCTKCNKAVGALGDSHENISRVIKYLGRSL